MHDTSSSIKRRLGLMSGAAVIALFAAGQPADALVITPNFGSSITGNANAAAIEGAINAAIGTIDGLYSPNNVSITVDFSYNPAAAGNLLSTSQFFMTIAIAPTRPR